MLVYVQRDGSGNIIGYAEQPQADASFDKSPTDTTDHAFANWLQAQQTLASIAAQLNVALGAGIIVTSTGTPSIDATYGLDDTTQHDLTAIAADPRLPGGASTVQFPDAANKLHTFTQPQIVALWQAGKDYIYGCKVTAALLSAGQTATWPSNQVTIP